ncbi:MAG: hypothetical protein ABIP50_00275 [Candidatus Saccharimonadales bacterium]
MKRSDIAMIVLIASVGILVAFFVTKSIFGEGTTESVNVQTIDPISSTIEEPSPTIFNENAINPTWSISLGSESTQTTTPPTGQ